MTSGRMGQGNVEDLCEDDLFNDTTGSSQIETHGYIRIQSADIRDGAWYRSMRFRTFAC